MDSNKGRTWQFLWWTYPTLGEPRISVFVLYCVSYVFYFYIRFILFLHDPIFLTKLAIVVCFLQFQDTVVEPIFIK
jgi:hypothetical protein